MPSVLLQLQNTRTFLNTHCWCQGANARNSTDYPVDISNEFACSFCLNGALWKANGIGVEMAFQYLLDQSVKRNGGISFIAFNDTPGRTKEEVIEFLDAVIEDRMGEEAQAILDAEGGPDVGRTS